MKKNPINLASFILNNQMEPELKFKVTEAYKAIRTKIALTLPKTGCKKILFCSAVPGEGKSTTAVNVGISLAQAGFRVLLVDASLRDPKIHYFFNLNAAPGLTEVFSSEVDFGELVHPTPYNGLSVLCAGTAVSNPSERLASSQMADAIKKLENGFDYILFDTPALNTVADALPLILLSDGVILVVRANASTHPELSRTLAELELIHANILGFLLNDADE